MKKKTKDTMKLLILVLGLLVILAFSYKLYILAATRPATELFRKFRNDDDEPKSLKYRGHRYKRKHRRN